MFAFSDAVRPCRARILVLPNFASLRPASFVFPSQTRQIDPQIQERSKIERKYWNEAALRLPPSDCI